MSGRRAFLRLLGAAAVVPVAGPGLAALGAELVLPSDTLVTAARLPAPEGYGAGLRYNEEQTLPPAFDPAERRRYDGAWNRLMEDEYYRERFRSRMRYEELDKITVVHDVRTRFGSPLPGMPRIAEAGVTYTLTGPIIPARRVTYAFDPDALEQIGAWGPAQHTLDAGSQRAMLRRLPPEIDEVIADKIADAVRQDVVAQLRAARAGTPLADGALDARAT